MLEIDVCFTPSLLSQHVIGDKIAVVVDIFRATTTICYGIANGAVEIIPVLSPGECRNYKDKDYLLAAERDGKVVDGFDFGNSPFSYTREKIEGKKIALTTTNGTMAIREAKNASAVIMGSFLNIQALADWIAAQNKSVLVLCAGWKGAFNLEDTVFSGALIEKLQRTHRSASDASLAALFLFRGYKKDLFQLLKDASHAERLKNLGIEKDLVFCLQQDICEAVPIYQHEKIISYQQVINICC